MSGEQIEFPSLSFIFCVYYVKFITDIFTFDSNWNISKITRIIDPIITDRVFSLRYQKGNFAVVC